MEWLERLTSGRSNEFYDPIGLGAPTSLFFAVVAEVFCSVLIFVGLFTRIAAVPLIIASIISVVAVKFDLGFKEMEPALLYLMIYAMILVIGPGKYSIDRYIKKLKKERFQ